MRPKGLLPDTAASLRRLAHFLVPHRELVGTGVITTPVDWNVGWSDQGNESSCTGHGNEKMIFGTAKANGYAGSRGDPRSIYALRALDYPGLSAAQPLPDEGASPATILSGLALVGCLAAGDGPPDVASRLDFAQTEAAFRVPKVALIDVGGDALTAALLQGLAKGCASFCMNVDASYENLVNDQIYKGPTGPSLGGHCQAVDAWRNGLNEIEWGVPGSWGAQFGRIWIPNSVFVQVATDIYIGQVVATLRPQGVS